MESYKEVLISCSWRAVKTAERDQDLFTRAGVPESPWNPLGLKKSPSPFEGETEITVLQNNMQLPSTRIQAHLAIGVKII